MVVQLIACYLISIYFYNFDFVPVKKAFSGLQERTICKIRLTQKKLMMNIKPIKTKKEYEAALARVYELMQKNLKANSKQSDELEVLSILVEAYENEHYPIPPPHPIEAIKFRMEQGAVDDKELTKLLGGRSRKSEILSGKRKLSLNMIRALHKKLKIPVESLINAY